MDSVKTTWFKPMITRQEVHLAFSRIEFECRANNLTVYKQNDNLQTHKNYLQKAELYCRMINPSLCGHGLVLN